MILSDPTREPSRDRLIRAAAGLFHERGIRATGVDRVVEAAGLTKPTLYQHFASKEDLVVAVIEYRSANWRQGLDDQVGAATTPQRKLLAVFDFLEDFIGDPGFRGCALVNAAVEIPSPASPGRDAVRRNKRDNRELMARLAREAGLKRPKELAAALSLLFEGAIVTAYVEGDRSAGRQARRAAQRLISAHSSRQ